MAIPKAERSTDIGWAVAATCIDLFLFCWLFAFGFEGVWAIEGHYSGMQYSNPVAYQQEAVRTLATVGGVLAVAFAAFRCVRAFVTHAVVAGSTLAVIAGLPTVGS